MRNVYKVSRSAMEVLNYILRYKTENNGKSPSVREIMKGCGFRSTSVAHYHLKRLQSAGVIEREAGKVRSIRIIHEVWSSLSAGRVNG